MSRAQWLGAVLAIGGMVNATAQDVIRTEPDEWISRHLLDTERDASFPSISDDGRFVAYQGQHPDVSFADVAYVTDRQNPATPQRIGGDCVHGLQCEQERPHISGNGRYVIFDSPQGFGGDPFSGDGAESDSDVFVWDRQNATTQRISIGVGGVEPNGESYAGDISRDGRYVAFESLATNLVSTPSLAGAPQRLRSYWKDLQSGETKLVYEGANTEARNVEFVRPRITTNGRYVLAWRPNSSGGNLVGYYAINWDALTATTGYRIPADAPANFRYAMTADRRFIAATDFRAGTYVQVYRVQAQQQAVFEYGSTWGDQNVVGGVDLSSGAGFLGINRCIVSVTNHTVDFYSRDLRHALVRLDFNDFNGCGQRGLGFDLTPDGHYAVVAAYDIRRAPFALDFDDRADIYLVVNPLWKPGPTNLVAQFTSIPANSRNVKVSTNGTIGVFESEIPASEFGPYTDTNGTSDVFRYLQDFQQIELISTADGTAAFPGGARNPAMSADGEAVVFEAPDVGITVKNLQPSGGLSAPMASKTSTTSIFLRRLVQNTPQRVSTSRSGGVANGSSVNPTISPDGRWAGFATDATDVNPGSDPNAVRDVVAVNLDTGLRHCVSSCAAVVADGPSDHPSISNIGSVAFESSSGALQKAAGASKASTSVQVFLRDLIQNTHQLISRSGTGQGGDGASTKPSISSSGKVIAYQSSASNLDASGNDGRTNVFRYMLGGVNQRVSRRAPPPGGKTTVVVDGDSLRPAVSGDGRFIAFQSAATNLADADNNGVVDLVVYDGRKGGLRRLSEGFGGAEANGASETPHLNHNGTVVGFHSFASNLAAESDSETASATSAPYERDNPLAEGIVFADAFE